MLEKTALLRQDILLRVQATPWVTANFRLSPFSPVRNDEKCHKKKIIDVVIEDKRSDSGNGTGSEI